jgi:hypothetical protein
MVLIADFSARGQLSDEGALVGAGNSIGEPVQEATKAHIARQVRSRPGQVCINIKES